LALLKLHNYMLKIVYASHLIHICTLLERQVALFQHLWDIPILCHPGVVHSSWQLCPNFPLIQHTDVHVSNPRAFNWIKWLSAICPADEGQDVLFGSISSKSFMQVTKQPIASVLWAHNHHVVFFHEQSGYFEDPVHGSLHLLFNTILGLPVKTSCIVHALLNMGTVGHFSRGRKLLQYLCYLTKVQFERLELL
jgi:hypothetical protein